MKLGIRPVMRGDRLEGATIASRFPVAFRLPAAEVGQRRGGGALRFLWPPPEPGVNLSAHRALQ